MSLHKKVKMTAPKGYRFDITVDHASNRLLFVKKKGKKPGLGSKHWGVTLPPFIKVTLE